MLEIKVHIKFQLVSVEQKPDCPGNTIGKVRQVGGTGTASDFTIAVPSEKAEELHMLVGKVFVFQEEKP